MEIVKSLFGKRVEKIENGMFGDGERIHKKMDENHSHFNCVWEHYEHIILSGSVDMSLLDACNMALLFRDRGNILLAHDLETDGKRVVCNGPGTDDVGIWDFNCMDKNDNGQCLECHIHPYSRKESNVGRKGPIQSVSEIRVRIGLTKIDEDRTFVCITAKNNPGQATDPWISHIQAKYHHLFKESKSPKPWIYSYIGRKVMGILTIPVILILWIGNQSTRNIAWMLGIAMMCLGGMYIAKEMALQGRVENKIWHVMVRAIEAQIKDWRYIRDL